MWRPGAVRQTAGCIPLRDGKVGECMCVCGRMVLTATEQLLLVASRKYPGQFVFPKGGIDPEDESARHAAVRETSAYTCKRVRWCV
jgi:8-oxo-dGTP pyrophosphatase MutT (NUDIX family)